MMKNLNDHQRTAPSPLREAKACLANGYAPIFAHDPNGQHSTDSERSADERVLAARLWLPSAVIAVGIDDAPALIGISRTRIFEAVRNGEITVRKAGRSTIIEVDELRRWVRSLPTKGRPLEPVAA